MKTVAAILINLIFVLFAFSKEQINVADYGVRPDGGDCTEGLQKALAKAFASNGGAVLNFGPGTYHFGPNFAPELYLFNSNNDEGLKRIVFKLDSAKDVEINGNGANFIFHGKVVPFCVKNSRNISFKNFSVDYFRPMHSEAKAVETGEGYTVVEIDTKQYPFTVQLGILKFLGKPDNLLLDPPEKIDYPFKRMIEFDAAKRETAYMTRDRDVYLGLPAQRLSETKVKLFHPTLRPAKGDVIVFQPHTREYPGFVVTASENVSFDGITIYSSGSMGILGENSADIFVRNCKFTPSEGRMMSCGVDATHFVNCSGKIVLDSNLFENQLDDATNIHGIYEQIVRIDSNCAVTRLVHMHQWGFDTFKKGQAVEFVDAKSMVTLGKGQITAVERINKEFKRVFFKENVPSNVKVKDAVAVLRDYPEVAITNNTIRNNRARGMLINSRGKTLIENNYFHSPGTALLFEGDASFWFEQGGVSDCTIRNNTFDNCSFGVWGSGIIAVGSGIRAGRDVSRYHKNILIENNTFNIFDDFPLLNIYCVDGLTWRGNKINRTTAYPPRKIKNPKLFKIENCDNIVIEK